jgi:hypothetical protein
MISLRTYSELSSLDTLDERFDYLALDGHVGRSTFGYDRWVNQSFYKSKEWLSIRSHVIVRDDGGDMGLSDFPIRGAPQIHHMNPLTIKDIEDVTDNLLDPEYLICVSQRTHNAIHFGDRSHLPREPIVRTYGDTRLW